MWHLPWRLYFATTQTQIREYKYGPYNWYNRIGDKNCSNRIPSKGSSTNSSLTKNNKVRNTVAKFNGFFCSRSFDFSTFSTEENFSRAIHITVYNQVLFYGPSTQRCIWYTTQSKRNMEKYTHTLCFSVRRLLLAVQFALKGTLQQVSTLHNVRVFIRSNNNV